MRHGSQAGRGKRQGVGGHAYHSGSTIIVLVMITTSGVWYQRCGWHGGHTSGQNELRFDDKSWANFYCAVSDA